MREDLGHRRNAAIDRDDRHFGVDRLFQRRRHRVDVDRTDNDAVDALSQSRLDVGGLLGRVILAIALDRIQPLIGRLGLEHFQHVDKHRKVQARNG